MYQQYKTILAECYPLLKISNVYSFILRNLKNNANKSKHLLNFIKNNSINIFLYIEHKRANKIRLIRKSLLSSRPDITSYVNSRVTLCTSIRHIEL